MQPDLAWATGLFEGEGCVTMTRGKRYLSGRPGRAYLSLSVSMHARDRDVLERFKAAVGCGNVAGPHKNGMLRWSITGSGALRLVRREHFSGNLGDRRRARIAECLAELDAQPPALTPSELGRLGGRPRKAIAA